MPPCVGLRFRGLKKSFGSVRAVDGADLEVRAGGTSRCWPVWMWQDHDAADDGRVRAARRGQDHHRRAGRGRSRRWCRPRTADRDGVPGLALFPHMDVAANIGYGLRGEARGGPGAGRWSSSGSATGAAARHELSGGEPQRVALAAPGAYPSLSCSTSRSRASTPGYASGCARRSRTSCAMRRHGGLRDARPGGGDEHRRARRGHARRPRRAVRDARGFDDGTRGPCRRRGSRRRRRRPCDTPRLRSGRRGPRR